MDGVSSLESSDLTGVLRCLPDWTLHLSLRDIYNLSRTDRTWYHFLARNVCDLFYRRRDLLLSAIDDLMSALMTHLEFSDELFRGNVIYGPAIDAVVFLAMAWDYAYPPSVDRKQLFYDSRVLKENSCWNTVGQESTFVFYTHELPDALSDEFRMLCTPSTSAHFGLDTECGLDLVDDRYWIYYRIAESDDVLTEYLSRTSGPSGFDFYLYGGKVRYRSDHDVAKSRSGATARFFGIPRLEHLRLCRYLGIRFLLLDNMQAVHITSIPVSVT